RGSAARPFVGVTDHPRVARGPVVGVTGLSPQPVDAATRHHASHSGAWGTPDRSLRRLGYPGLRRVNGRGKPDVSERRQVYTRLRIALPGAIPTVDGRAHRHTVAHTSAHQRTQPQHTDPRNT